MSGVTTTGHPRCSTCRYYNRLSAPLCMAILKPTILCISSDMSSDTTNDYLLSSTTSRDTTSDCLRCSTLSGDTTSDYLLYSACRDVSRRSRLWTSRISFSAASRRSLPDSTLVGVLAGGFRWLSRRSRWAVRCWRSRRRVTLGEYIRR
jgi:hypothetical protein